MRVAVVGHGASLECAGLGSQIDAADLVVRMHDCGWQMDRAPAGLDPVGDWGERWDIGILPGPWGEKRWSAGCVGRPSRGWWCYRLKRKDRAPQTFRERPVDSFDLSWTRELLSSDAAAETVPSRGLAAALMALRRSDCREICLYGMDRIANGDLEGTGYPEALNARSPLHAAETRAGLSGPVIGPHHYGAERDLLASYAADAKVKVAFMPHRSGAA